MGKTNGQTITGNKFFTGTNVFSNASQQWMGGTISATFSRMTNGYHTNAVLDNPVFTNSVNYGNAFSSLGTGPSSEQFGSGALATNNSSLAVGNTALSIGYASTAVGSFSVARADYSSVFGIYATAYTNAQQGTALGFAAVSSNLNATAVGAYSAVLHTNSTAIGYQATTTAPNQVMLGSPGTSTIVNNVLSVGDSITNTVLTGNTTNKGTIAFRQYSNGSLANGNNAAVDLGESLGGRL